MPGNLGATLLVKGSVLSQHGLGGGHSWLPQNQSTMKYNSQANCRQKWVHFPPQRGRENHTKNPKKLEQFTNLSGCLQQLVRAARTSYLFSCLSTTTIPVFLQLIWALDRRSSPQLSSEEDGLNVSSPASEACVIFQQKAAQQRIKSLTYRSLSAYTVLLITLPSTRSVTELKWLL